MTTDSTINQPTITDSCLLALYSETSLHPGTGQSTGVIDLPVERERHTGTPVLAASGLKGSLREVGEREWGKDSRQVDVLFGPEDGDLHGGAIAFGEAHLLTFPVRSLIGVFNWITCPLVLERLHRDLALAGLDSLSIPSLPVKSETALAPEGSAFSGVNSLALEDLSFTVRTDASITLLGNSLVSAFLPGDAVYKELRDRFVTHLLLISDEDFFYLVRHATQVVARVKLTSGKTTDKFQDEKGNLWYEETLPRDCLFYSITRFEAPRAQILPADIIRTKAEVSIQFQELIRSTPYLQIGGNETIGQGWCRLHIATFIPGQMEVKEKS